MTDTPPTKSPGFLLHDVARTMGKRFEQVVREETDCGLTRAQYKTLAYLRFNEGLPQSALADMLEIEPITLTRIVDKLQHAGLVERRPHETDRRAWRLYLTPAALPILDELAVVAAQIRTESMRGLSPEDVEAFFRILETMKTNILEACASRAAVKPRSET